MLAAVPEKLEEAVRFGAYKEEPLELGVGFPHHQAQGSREAGRFLCQLEASLMYIVSSRPTRTTYWDPVSKENNNKMSILCHWNLSGSSFTLAASWTPGKLGTYIDQAISSLSLTLSWDPDASLIVAKPMATVENWKPDGYNPTCAMGSRRYQALPHSSSLAWTSETRFRASLMFFFHTYELLLMWLHYKTFLIFSNN